MLLYFVLFCSPSSYISHIYSNLCLSFSRSFSLSLNCSVISLYSFLRFLTIITISASLSLSNKSNSTSLLSYSTLQLELVKVGGNFLHQLIYQGFSILHILQCRQDTVPPLICSFDNII